MNEKDSGQGVCATLSLFAAVDCMDSGSRSHLVVSDRGSVDCCPSCPGLVGVRPSISERRLFCSSWPRSRTPHKRWWRPRKCPCTLYHSCHSLPF